MARGGRRSGTPGTAYGQRTDMNATSGAPSAAGAVSPGGSSTYGQGAALQADKRALPPSPQQGFGAAPPVPSGPAPGSVTPLSAPTEHPDEPLTAGLASGPGAGPEVLSFNNQQTQDLAQLRQFLPYLRFHAQNPDTPQSVLNLLRRLESITP